MCMVANREAIQRATRPYSVEASMDGGRMLEEMAARLGIEPPKPAPGSHHRPLRIMKRTFNV